MYVSPNYKSKAALKRGLAAGDFVTIFQVGPFGGNEPENAPRQAVEGPHFPAAHSWYGIVKVENGVVTKVVQ
jgi:hypothetical protein